MRFLISIINNEVYWSKYIRKILIKLILIYQRTAPKKLRASCRFEPSCSNYGILAINKYGAFKGFIMTTKRICRCRKPNGGVEYP